MTFKNFIEGIQNSSTLTLLIIVILFFISVYNLNKKENKKLLDYIEYVILFIAIVFVFILQVEANLKHFFTIQELKTRIKCIENILEEKHLYDKRQCKNEKLIKLYKKLEK